MSKLEKIIEVIENMDDSDLVRIHNNYCQNCNLPDDEIYMNDLDDVLCGCSPTEVAMKIRFGNWNPSHDYCWFNGNGNIESGDGYMLLDHQIFPSDIAREAIDDDHDFGCDEIREILDEEGE